MAPKRIYTRSNPDPNPPIAVENPEKILRESSSKVGKETYQLYKSTNLPVEGVESIHEVTFDLKFEQIMFKLSLLSKGRQCTNEENKIEGTKQIPLCE